jgi:hypothetical protein
MFHEAVADCDKAIEINKNWLKAYIRKAIAIREMIEDKNSITKALEIFKLGHSIANS